MQVSSDESLSVSREKGMDIKDTVKAEKDKISQQMVYLGEGELAIKDNAEIRTWE